MGHPLKERVRHVNRNSEAKEDEKAAPIRVEMAATILRRLD